MAITCPDIGVFLEPSDCACLVVPSDIMRNRDMGVKPLHCEVVP